MIPKGLITHIALIGLSVGIFFTYLQPSFHTVRESQDQVALYKSEREKVEGVNARLNALVSDAAAISAQDRALLNRYLPETIDEVAVQRDILAILDAISVVPTTLSAGGDSSASASTEGQDAATGIAAASKLNARHFTTSATVRYEEVLSLLRLFEVNAYPLDVVSLGIAAAGGGVEEGVEAGIPGALAVDFDITSYALARENKTE